MFIATNARLTKEITECRTSDAKLHAAITEVQESGNLMCKRKEQTMSKYDRDIQDVYAVKQLGDAIGYGHLMAIAHELWARHLEDKGLPRSGAHCVVGYPMVKEEYQTEALNDPIYTIVVDKALADRKTEQTEREGE